MEETLDATWLTEGMFFAVKFRVRAQFLGRFRSGISGNRHPPQIELRKEIKTSILTTGFEDTFRVRFLPSISNTVSRFELSFSVDLNTVFSGSDTLPG